MKELTIRIEIDGQQEVAGYIRGNDYMDAVFSYDRSYLDREGILPISVSLPLQEERFTPEQTGNFFEGLLPEGFSRRSVAGWAKVDERDYLGILEQLGQECLGAISVRGEEEPTESGYQRLNREQVKALAAEGATTSTKLLLETHLSLTGASGKVGLYYNEPEKAWYLPIGDAPSSHIVKQSHVRYGQIVLNEQICIETARNLGITVPESFIVDTGKGLDADVLYATKRYDRTMSGRRIDGLQVPFRRHQEDFAQALGIPAAQKYETSKRGYLKKMFDLIVRVSANPIADQLALWDEIVFQYLIGNTDCHLKNYSLLYAPDMHSLRLAPAYDLVCTSAYATTRQNSMYIGDKVALDEITRADFLQAAGEIGLGRKMAMTHFDDLAERFDGALEKAIESLTNQGFSQAEELGQKMRRNRK